MTFFSVFDVPVFWPILLFYWIVLFFLTMKRQILHMIKYKYIPFNIGKQVKNPSSFSYNLSIITVFFPTRTRINQFSFLFTLCDAEIHREDGCHDQQFWLIRDVLQRECTRRRDHMIGIYFFYQDSSMKIFIWVWGLSNLSRNFLGQLLSLYTLVIFSCSLLLLNFHCWTKFLGTNKQRVEWTGVYIYWWRKWK